MGQGGHFRLAGSGKQFEGTVGRNVWLRVKLPVASCTSAIGNGLNPLISIEMDGVVGPLWISGRPELSSNAP